MLGDIPRNTRRPSRCCTEAELSALTKTRNLLKSIRCARVTPLRTSPNLIIGSNTGVVAQATYVVYGPNVDGSGSPSTSMVMLYTCRPLEETATPNGVFTRPIAAVPDASIKSGVGISAKQ